MTLHIKYDNTWSNANPYIKNNNSWVPAKQIYAKINGSWTLAYTAGVVDTFTKPDGSNIGTIPDSNYTWNSLSGAWNISSNKLSTNTGGSSYPIITIDYENPDAIVTLSTNDQSLNNTNSSYGGGVVFWATNSSNWWAAHSDTVRTTVYTCPPTINTGTTATYSTGSISSDATGACYYTYGATQNTSQEPVYTSVFGCPNGGSGPRTLFYYKRQNTATSSTNAGTATWAQTGSSISNQCILSPAYIGSAGSYTGCTSFRTGNNILDTYIYTSPSSGGGYDCYNINFTSGVIQTGTSTASATNGPARPIYQSNGAGQTYNASWYNQQTGTQTVTTYTCNYGGSKISDSTLNGCQVTVTSTSTNYVNISYTYDHKLKVINRSNGQTPVIVKEYTSVSSIKNIGITTNSNNLTVSYSTNSDGSSPSVDLFTPSINSSKGNLFGIGYFPSTFVNPGVVPKFDDFTISTS